MRARLAGNSPSVDCERMGGGHGHGCSIAGSRGPNLQTCIMPHRLITVVVVVCSVQRVERAALQVWWVLVARHVHNAHPAP